MFLNLFTILLYITTLSVASPNSPSIMTTRSVPSSTESTSPNPSGADTLLGINCRGSFLCFNCRDIHVIKGYMDEVDDKEEWYDGEQIVCAQCPFTFDSEEGICAFTQKMHGKTITGKKAKEKVQDLIDHGCKGCGSCPTEDSGNNVDDGELTINYVEHTCGEGVCPFARRGRI